LPLDHGDDGRESAGDFSPGEVIANDFSPNSNFTTETQRTPS
jgi:hypothetical protein